MLVKEFEGKNEKEVIKLALDTLKLQKDQVKIEMVDSEKKASFFGFRSKKPVKIKVFYEENKINNKLSLRAKNYLVDLFNIMGIKAKINLEKEEENKIYMTINSSESGLLIGKKGKNLEAIQILLNMSIHRYQDQKNKHNYKKIILDIEGYLDRRQEFIKQLALKTANIVRISKRSTLLESMNPFERHLIHVSLQDFNDIGTRSEGEGNYKKIRVYFKS